MKDYGVPPRGDENRDLIGRRLEEARESSGSRETVTVEWNKRQIHLDVVELPLRDLYYNPGTHRVEAQKDHKPKLGRILRDEPWSERSQEYLDFLLRGKPANPDEADPEFEELKDSLAEVGQQEPGLVTREGVLVNGNTRAAALRKLGKTSIRVGVLPSSFTWEDINSVELFLQLRPDKRRGYSYINRLLAMEEQDLLGRAAEDIARDFHIQTKTFRQERWILGVIREMMGRSETPGGDRLRPADFEGHQENLKELHRAYMKLDASSHERAELLKENRIAAIVLDFAKTRTRLIDDKFQEEYLGGAEGVGESPGEEPAARVSIPGLNVSVAASSRSVSAAKAFTDEVLRAKAAEGGAEPEEGRKAAGAARLRMRRAIVQAERDERLRRVRQTTAERLDEACACINQSVADLVEARAVQSLDEESLDEALLRLKGSLTKLAQQASRGLSEPGEGVSWLVEAVAKGRL